MVCSLNLPSAQYGNVRSLLVQPHDCAEVALYSDRRVYELHFNNEQDQVWRQLITRKSFSEALKVAPNAEDKALVVAAEGEELFRSNDFIAAADKLAQAGTTAVSFEEVCLAFISQDQHRALLNYVTKLTRSLVYGGARRKGVQVPVMFLWAGQMFSPVLFRAHPEQFITYLIAVPRSGVGSWQTVDPRLSRTMQLIGGEPSSWTALMDLLTQLKAMEPDEDGEEQELCRYIRTQGEMPHFDVTSALRVCYSMGKTRALTVAYGLVGQYKLAVDVALEHDDLDLAIHNAQRCRSSKSEKRKIWLTILNYEAKKGDMNALLKFYQESDDVLTIADVLSSIPVNSSNGATLGMFRSEIEKSLDQYETDIHLLNMELEQHKKTMDVIESYTSQRAVERDFGGGPSDGSNVEGGLGRCVILSQTQRCDLCRQIIYSRGFYAFLCGHTMHKDCLEEAIALMPPASGTDSPKDPAADCYICGSNLMDSLFMPFIDPNYDRNEMRDWEVGIGR
ncbi:hypothetical protein Pmar_PMAR018075 [Perkinsus marinus ATCC 50983]|uniref:Uncharacterized protein n=1 Tax=Perkinsus marinus (strain ATCC 50983 / TXsc) TaxID=423536 RepID=C5KRX9_PERM5|nr:hypothetical protein Pmar_PMAR018075 [Perkinsus marinus ATCC 50983]EER12820.1 hypothetical protein Pmar_PMAR018075 [Perkinsus marinus ATCC 50983]|eukprot:XP_002781025.1 hypothetical protein Pmar_PMAR018075 [Perkinsus marinus ATCC 50983]